MRSIYLKISKVAEAIWEVAKLLKESGQLPPLSVPELDRANLFYSKENRERLQAFGEGATAFDGVSSDVLPDTAPSLGPLQTCALVGNSGSLTAGAALGAHIDQQQAVVRINQAPAGKRYAKWVGARTTHRVLNKKWAMIYGQPQDRWGHRGTDVIHARRRQEMLEDLRRERATLLATRSDTEDLTALVSSVLGMQSLECPPGSVGMGASTTDCARAYLVSRTVLANAHRLLAAFRF
eukprot:gene19275-23044_t